MQSASNTENLIRPKRIKSARSARPTRKGDAPLLAAYAQRWASPILPSLEFPLSQIRNFAAAATFLFAIAAHAEPVLVLDRRLELDPPNGFCPLGVSEREAKLLQMQRSNTAPAGELVQFTVPCSELPEYRDGKIDSFSRWAQVLVLRRRGQLTSVSETREEFVRATASNVSTKSVDLAEIDRRLDQHLFQTGITVSMSGMEPVGIKDSSFFAIARFKAEASGDVVPIVAVVAVTVANRLPIAVQVYGTQRATGESLANIASSYVQRVISKNDE